MGMDYTGISGARIACAAESELTGAIYSCFDMVVLGHTVVFWASYHGQGTSRDGKSGGLITGRCFEEQEGSVSLLRMKSFLEFLLRRYVDLVEELGVVVTIWYVPYLSGPLLTVRRVDTYSY